MYGRGRSGRLSGESCDCDCTSCAMAGTGDAAAAMGGLDWVLASAYSDDEGVLVPDESGEGVAFGGEGLSRLENPTPDDVRCIGRDGPYRRADGKEVQAAGCSTGV